jgi:hypothetical protein
VRKRVKNREEMLPTQMLINSSVRILNHVDIFGRTLALLDLLFI